MEEDMRTPCWRSSLSLANGTTWIRTDLAVSNSSLSRTDRLRELSALFLVCLFTLTVAEKAGKEGGGSGFFVEKQKKFPENLEISKKVCTFAPANDEQGQMPS